MFGEDWIYDADKIVGLGQNVLFILYSLSMGCFFGSLSRPFLDDKKRDASLAGIIYAVFMIINTLFPIDLPKGCGSVIRICFGFVVLYLIDRSRPKQKFFVSLLFYTIATLCMQLNAEQGMYFDDLIFDVLPFNTTAERSVILYFVGLSEDAVFYAFALGIGIIMSKRSICLFDEDISWRDLLILSLPFMLIFMQILVYSDYYDLFGKYSVLLSDVGDKDTLSTLSYNSIPRLFNMLLFYIFILVFVWCFFDIKRISRDNINAAILDEQTSAMKEHVKKMDEMYGKIRSVRHDMNHHSQVLSALLGEGKYDEARQYLSSMEEFMRDTRPTFSTGNPVTDIIISERAEEASKIGIEFDADFVYPSDYGFDIFDISGILGNAFSNAFAACRDTSGEKHIAIRSITKGNMYLIEMKNSYSGELVIDTTTGLPKRNIPSDRHGIGLMNVQRIAQKYGGDVMMEQKDGEVVFSIILQRAMFEK